MHIDILVKDVRLKKGVTISALAKKSGVSAAHLSDIEKNFKSPSLLVMVRIAKALNVDITELYKVKWWLKMIEKYKESMEALQLYMKTVKNIPSELDWNNYAVQEKLLSSKSIEYYSNTKFNKLCRKIIKEINKKQKS